MQHGSRQVEDRAQPRPRGVGRATPDGGEQVRLVGRRQAAEQALAGGGQLGADAGGDRLPAECGDAAGQLLQESIDGRKVDFLRHAFTRTGQKG